MDIVGHYIPCPYEKNEDSEENTTSEEQKPCPSCEHMYIETRNGWFIKPEYAQTRKRPRSTRRRGRH